MYFIRRHSRRDFVKAGSASLIYGSVLGSFCCEKFGVDRFRTLTRAEIDARFHEFKACTSLRFKGCCSW